MHVSQKTMSIAISTLANASGRYSRTLGMPKKIGTGISPSEII
jgi:hypothetical protein